LKALEKSRRATPVCIGMMLMLASLNVAVSNEFNSASLDRDLRQQIAQHELDRVPTSDIQIPDSSDALFELGKQLFFRNHCLVNAIHPAPPVTIQRLAVAMG